MKHAPAVEVVHNVARPFGGLLMEVAQGTGFAALSGENGP